MLFNAIPSTFLDIGKHLKFYNQFLRKEVKEVKTQIKII